MKSYTSTEYTLTDRTRLVQGVWSDVIISVQRGERVFRESGHVCEAEKLRAMATVFAQSAVCHLDRMLANGHYKDSQADADSHLTPPVSAQTVTGGSELPGLRPRAFDESPVAAPASDVVEIPLPVIIQRRIEELMLMADTQEREVAIKFMHRARAIFESGTDHRGRLLSGHERGLKAWELIKSAANVLESKAEVQSA